MICDKVVRCMDLGQLRYDIQVIRRAYSRIGRYPDLCLTFFVLICFLLTSCFLIFVFEPVSDWHETSFVLEQTVYRKAGRTGYVLDVYTTEGRKFVINENDEFIRDQLEEQKRYYAVYADDYFADIIKGLCDGETVYLNVDDIRNQDQKFFVGFYVALFVSGFLLILLNAIFIKQCVQSERRRMNSFRRKKKK